MSLATLADSFLQDLADLENEEEEEDEPTLQARKDSFQPKHTEIVSNDSNLYSDDDDDDDEIPDAIKSYEVSQTKSGLIVSTLSIQPDFVKFISTIRELISEEPKLVEDELCSSTRVLHPSEAALLEESNTLIAKLDVEILNIYSFVRDLYGKKFPELESIVVSPLEYIAVVQRINNETDLTTIELGDILPNTVTMAVTVAASMTIGCPLPASDLERVLKACEEAVNLGDKRKLILGYLESRMDMLAPNVSAIIGSALAARLITHAHGLSQLARMPSQNIMLVGATSSTSKGASGAAAGIVGGAITSSAGAAYTRSIIYSCDIVQMTPPSTRSRALRLVSGKVGLAARVDSFHESPDGSIGNGFRAQILKQLLKAQEPPPAPLKKALPVPDDGRKSRRGGKRYRRTKEKFRISELRKEANRLKFGPEAENEYGLEGEVGFGSVDSSHGSLRLQTKQLKLQVKRHKKGTAKTHVLSGPRVPASSQASSGATGGMSSSLAFTPVQGIELCDPSQMARRQQETLTNADCSNKYFSSSISFVKPEISHT